VTWTLAKDSQRENKHDPGVAPKPTPEKDIQPGAAYKKGDFIGQKYEVHSVLGKGGFGLVYGVYDRQTRDVYALKTFLDEYLADAQTRDLFRKEAGIWVELERHPYLVRAYFVDEISGRLYIAMEYIAPNKQGINTLAGYLQRRPPDLAQSLRWAIQICYGMEYAHSKGIRAHRDIKPENIMIGQDGTAKITDFGLASVLGASLAKPGIGLDARKEGIFMSGQTQKGVGFGTPTHMPPEQFDNAAGCDERSDIYAFGAVLFQMASGGQLPFTPPPLSENSEQAMANLWQTMRRQHREAPVPQLDSPLFPIIKRCLEKEPGRRYQSFKQLRSDLEPLLKRQSGEVIRMPKLGELEAGEWGNKGFSLHFLGCYEEAIRCLDKALELDPCDALAWNNKGASLDKLDRPEEAISCYEKALKVNPQYAHAWGGKGICLAHMNEHAQALKCFEQALNLDPQEGINWSNKGVSLNAQGCYEEAIQSFDQALALNPQDTVAWNGKGFSLNYLRKYKEASHCFDKTIQINPLDINAWNGKGLNIGLDGRHEEAVACFDQSLKIDPQSAVIWDLKGESLRILGRNEESIQCFDRSLEIDPGSATTWLNKGKSLL
jgi:tetratricopeptide (TPR) repeat protein